MYGDLCAVVVGNFRSYSLNHYVSTYRGKGRACTQCTQSVAEYLEATYVRACINARTCYYTVVYMILSPGSFAKRHYVFEVGKV